MTPDDTEFTKWLLSLGTGGAIAAILFIFYRKDQRQYTELWKAQAELNLAQAKAMMELIERSAIIITQNTEVLKSLHRRLDNSDRDREEDRSERTQRERNERSNNRKP